MTADDRIKMTLGDLLVRNALLQAENDALKQQLEAAKSQERLGDDLHT